MKVGIQLYSVRNNMAKDPLATIAKVAEMGYKYIEVANHNAEADAGVGFGVSPSQINEVLSKTGAKIVSAHIFPMDAKKIEPVIEYHAQIGTKFIAMPMDFYKDRDETLRKAEILNAVGEKCKKAGMELLYHNHFHEFQNFGDETIFDILMNNTDPANVKIELDTYWAMRGGQKPEDIFRKYKGRVRLLHQKDMPKEYAAQINLVDAVNKNGTLVDMEYFESVVDNKTFTEIGTGLMDIQSIINVANAECDVEYIILEQDFTLLDEYESIKLSMESFNKFNGIEWK